MVTVQSFDFTSGKTIDITLRQGIVFIKDPDDAELLSETLRGKLYKVLGKTQDVREALELIRKYKTGILFLDTDIDGVDANAVMASVQAKFPKFNIVIVSSEATKENIQNAVSGGASGFLAKPLKADMVEKALSKII